MNKICFESQAVNPLVLLRKNQLPFLKNIYAEMNLNSTGSESENVLIAYYTEDNQRISILVADQLGYENKTLTGDKINFITHRPTSEEIFDHLIIDNQLSIKTPESFFSSLLTKNSETNKFAVFSTKKLFQSEDPKALAELLQRISKILFPLTFTLIGISAGLFSRKKIDKGSFIFLAFSIFSYFSCFFGLKNIHLPFYLACLLCIAPHFFIIFFSFLRVRKVERGAI